MKKEELDAQLKKLDVMYDRFNIATQEVYTIWQKSFSDTDPKVFESAVDEVIKNEEYAPNIAVVNKYVKQIEEERRAIISKEKECYNRAVYALNFQKNADDYMEFLKWLAKIPKERRMEAAEEFSYNVVSYANGMTAKGQPCKPFKELLKEAKC